MMDAKEFEVTLAAGGYLEVKTLKAPPGSVNATHAHEFDARLFIVEGELTLTRDGGVRTYRPGEVFEIPSGTPHSEQYGPTGATYLVGRRYSK